MNNKLLLLFFFMAPVLAVSQPVPEKLKKAFAIFQSDSQLSQAISSLYVVDAETGKVVFDHNSSVGLAGASTQKVITAATAFELLGEGFKYRTRFSYKGGKLYIEGSGDPTLGSDRFSGTGQKDIYSMLLITARKAGITALSGVEVNTRPLDKLLPGGWIFEDIGNYYGAGSQPFTWNENQYNLVFIPGKKKGEPTQVDSIATLYAGSIINNCLTGQEGSGDNAYIYFLPGTGKLLVRGTVPAGVSRFSIRGADPFPEQTFFKGLSSFAPDFVSGAIARNRQDSVTLFGHYSPSLDSISYWFLRESINLYGEALVYAIGGSNSDSGLQKIRKFWSEKGIAETELNIYDGSGLSPLNRITTHAQVAVLRFARSQPWFEAYLAGFKDTNGMKMKSGTINNVKGYCGYHQAKNGKKYIFSFLVNNYNGRSGTLVTKMFKVLDQLK